MDEKPQRVGRKPVFDEESLGEAALEIGLEEVSVAAVAKHIGVRSSALYRLVSDRTDLILLALDRISARIPLLEDEGSWQDILRRLAAQSWSVFENYPGLDQISVNTPGAFSAFQRHIQRAVELLVARGASPDHARFAIDMVGDAIVSTHRWRTALVHLGEDATIRNGKAMQYLQSTGRVPVEPADLRAIDETYLQAKLEFLLSAFACYWPDNLPAEEAHKRTIVEPPSVNPGKDTE